MSCKNFRFFRERLRVEILSESFSAENDSFLVFEISGPDQGLGFITPGGNMLGNTRLTYGNFSEGSIRDNIKDSRQGGLTVVFDPFQASEKPTM